MAVQESDPNARQPRASLELEPGSVLDRHARKLIARIRRNNADVEAVDALAAYYTKHNDHASLANLMEGYARTLPQAAAAAEAYVRAADAALLSTDRERAQDLYERALMREPNHSEALDRALRVAEAAQDVPALLRIIGATLSAAQARGEDPKLMAALHFRLGQVYESYVQDFDRAAELYRLAMGFNPQLVNATAAARRLYAQAGSHDAVSVLYEFEIDAVQAGEDKRALLLALAEHKAEHCDDLTGAVTALQRAAELDAGDVSTLRRLADAWLACSESRSGAARLGAKQRAAEVLYQLARAVQRADAWEVLTRALDLDPEHTRAAALLQELRGHATQGVKPESEAPPRSSHAQESQLAVDERDTLKILLPRSQRDVAAPEPVDRDSGDMILISCGATNATDAPDRLDRDAIKPEPTNEAFNLTAADEAEELSMADIDLLDADAVEAGAARDWFVRPPARSTVPPPFDAAAAEAARLNPARSTVPPRFDRFATEGRTRNRTRSSVPPPFDPIALEAAKRNPARSSVPPPFDHTASDAARPPTLRAIVPPPPDPLEGEPVDEASRYVEVHTADREPKPEARGMEPPVAADLATEDAVNLLSTDELQPTNIPPPVPDLTGRARIVDQLDDEVTRLTIEVSLDVTTESNLYVNVDNRLLDGGIFVASYQLPALGSPLLLHITLPGNLDAWAQGRVWMIRELDPFEDTTPGAYIAFEALTRESLALLGRFAAKRWPLLVDDT